MDDKSKQYVQDRRVQVTDLPTQSPINNLWRYFESFGRVKTAYQIVSRKGEVRNYGFIDFAERLSAEYLIRLSWLEIDGVVLKFSK